MEKNLTQVIGASLNLDDSDINKPKGSLTFALNAVISNFDGNEVLYQNEQSNQEFVALPKGSKPIFAGYVEELEKTLYFLDTQEIGLSDKAGIYTTVIKGQCLNFSKDFPIFQVVIKTTNCGVSFYWTDNNNGFRFVDLEDLPFKEVTDPNNDYKNIKLIGELDCNKLQVHPNFSIPQIELLSEEEGGNIPEGVVQFVTSYSNERGESYTSMYNVTNPIPIHQGDRATRDFNLPTNKALRLMVTGLDDTGVFDFFNLIVLETVNAITTPRLVGTYPITKDSYEILYTGNTQTSIQLSMEEIFQKYKIYDKAKGVTTSDDRIIWYGLAEDSRVNYQQIWSKAKLSWITYQLPNDAYKDGEMASKYKGYMGDEIYPIEGVFLLANGKQTASCHIPSRVAKVGEKDFVTNLDSNSVIEENCNEDGPQLKRVFEVYNTATVTEIDRDYEERACYKGIYQRGEFAYTESEERYPNNQNLWGDLSGTNIRHHKFPDELVAPRFRTIDGEEVIYAKGIEIDQEALMVAIQESTLTPEEQASIVGFKIVRGNRAEGNMSVMAKGHFTNVGKYKYEDSEYYFPNYPYNSVKEDPLFATSKIKRGTGFEMTKTLKPFKNGQGKDQFTFHSPDTHFGRVSSIDTGYVKMEAIDFGEGKGEIVDVKNNAEYKFLTRDSVLYAAALAGTLSVEYKGKKARASLSGADFASVYNNMTELFEKLTPFKNFGKVINSIASFNKSIPIPNSGNKLRRIESGKYLVDGFNSIEEGKTLNNTRRESSVYLKVNEDLPYAHEYDDLIPQDTSRFIYSYGHIANNIDSQDFLNNLYIPPQQMVGEQLRYAEAVAVAAYTIANEMSSNANEQAIILTLLVLILDEYAKIGNLAGLEALADIPGDCTNAVADTTVYMPAEGEVIQMQPFWSVYIDYLDRAFTAEDISPTTGLTLPGLSAAAPGAYQSIITAHPFFKIMKKLENKIPASISNNEIYRFSSIDDEQVEVDQYMVERWKSQHPIYFGPNGESHGGSLIILAIMEERARFNNPMYNVPFVDAEGMEFELDPFEVCGADLLKATYETFILAKEVFGNLHSEESPKNKKRDFDVNSYYGSIKRYLPAQWGRMFSYSTVDTGHYQDLKEEFKPIFGGDTFINKFSFKTKQQVYDTNLVGSPDQRDVALDEKGSLGYPMFWISTKPIENKFEAPTGVAENALRNLGTVVGTIVTANVLGAVGGALVTAGGGAIVSVVGAIPGAIMAAAGAIMLAVGALLTSKTTALEKMAVRLLESIIREVINVLGIKDLNLDNMREKGRVSSTGMIYQYVNGIPTYYVESQVNVDLRQATNDDEGNFYPRVGEGIPHDWLQEDRVPIIWDNMFHYNKSYSKQNRENFFHRYKEDIDFEKDCTKNFQNRAVWSEKTSLAESLDNWRIYKPVSYYDLPKTYGEITSIDGIKNRQLLVRFSNNSQLYNALTTIDTQGSTAYLGNDRLFTSSPPIDIESGSQHRMLINSPYGQIFVDSIKGEVILVDGGKKEVLSNKKVRRWFQNNLPFQNRKDNTYKDEGVTGVWDNNHERILITKRDKINSWTLSYSFKIGSWVSWHSYMPNMYIQKPTNFETLQGDKVWKHNTDPTSYHTYYGVKYPYILEFPITFGFEDEALQSFEDYVTALEYEDNEVYWEPDTIKYFNKALVYNRQQTTGILNLIPQEVDNLQHYMSYPRYNVDSKDILLAKRDNIYRFNDIFDITRQKGQKIFEKSDEPTKSNIKLYQPNLDYGDRGYGKSLIRAKDAKVRLTLDNDHGVKLISKVLIAESQKSKL